MYSGKDMILLQPGKGEGLGARGGMSAQFFGGGGAVSFLAKVTTGFAIAYMVLVILLAKVTQPSAEIETVPRTSSIDIEAGSDGDASTEDASSSPADAGSDTGESSDE